MSIFPALRLSGPQISSAPSGGGGGAEPNPNLLLWTEAFDNAVWSKTSASVDANFDGVADQITFTASLGVVEQATTTPAAAGSAAENDVTTTASYLRYSVSGTFDGAPYTFSVELKNAEGVGVRLRIARSGGVLVASLRDIGDGAMVLARYAQLEQAAAFTSYSARGGV